MKNRADTFFFIAALFSAVLALTFMVYVWQLRLAERNNRKAVIEAVSNPEESMSRLEKAMDMDGRNPVYPFNLSLLLAGRDTIP